MGALNSPGRRTDGDCAGTGEVVAQNRIAAWCVKCRDRFGSCWRRDCTKVSIVPIVAGKGGEFAKVAIITVFTIEVFARLNHRDAVEEKSVILQNLRSFEDLQWDKSPKERRLVVQLVSGTARICSLMFGYVRICSLSEEIFLPQGDQTGVLSE